MVDHLSADCDPSERALLADTGRSCKAYPLYPNRSSNVSACVLMRRCTAPSDFGSTSLCATGGTEEKAFTAPMSVICSKLTTPRPPLPRDETYAESCSGFHALTSSTEKRNLPEPEMPTSSVIVCLGRILGDLERRTADLSSSASFSRLAVVAPFALEEFALEISWTIERRRRNLYASFLSSYSYDKQCDQQGCGNSCPSTSSR